jgi:hypothetical protein
VNGVLRESVIGYKYVANPIVSTELYNIKPLFGKHHLLIFSLDCDRPKEINGTRRTWLKYSKDTPCEVLEREDLLIKSDTVQGTWNLIKHKLVKFYTR